MEDYPDMFVTFTEHGKSPNQILASWGVTRNTSVIPKSSKLLTVQQASRDSVITDLVSRLCISTANEQRIKENLDVIQLTPDDMAKIESIDKNKRFNDPSTSFGYVFFADEKPLYKSALDAITNAGMKAKAAAQSALGQSS